MLSYSQSARFVLLLRAWELSLHVAGNPLPQSDHNWFVWDAGRHGAVIENLGYGHRLTLDSDQIHDFRSNPSGGSFGFLNLNGQLWVRGNAAGVEPLPYRHGLALQCGTPAASPAPVPYLVVRPPSAFSLLLFCGSLLWAIAD
jgi:hypothetical protein